MNFTNTIAPTSTPTRAARAHVLDVGHGITVAFSPWATAGLVEIEELKTIPQSPDYCVGLANAAHRWFPVIDLARMIDPSNRAAKCPHALIIRNLSSNGSAMQWGAVLAPELVEIAQVSDLDSCALPESSPLWQEIAVSCFMNRGRAIPVIAPSRLFGSR